MFFPNGTQLALCKEAIEAFCVDYVLEGKNYFLLAAIGIVVTILGCGFMMVSLSAVMAHSDNRNLEPVKRSQRSEIQIGYTIKYYYLYAS